MKLSKKEAEKIAGNYNLGKIQYVKLIPSGWGNFSFDFKTNKGEFIVQVLGRKLDRGNMLFQFKLVNFLKKINFPYETPAPLKTKNNNYFMLVKGKHFWVYRKIIGKIVHKLNSNQLKEPAKTLAIYHKSVSKFNIKKKKELNYKWLENKYNKFENVKPKNKIDRLMLNNLGFFKKTVDKLKKYDWGNNFLVCHADLSGDNVVFRNGKIMGIIDFNNLEYSPLSSDIAISLYETSVKRGVLDKKRYKTFLKEYEKINKLTKKDKNLIIPLIADYYCYLFWWHYEGMQKHRHIRYGELKDDIYAIQNLSKFF